MTQYVISIHTVHDDGTDTMRGWGVDSETAEQIAALLGAPDAESLATREQCAAIAETMPPVVMLANEGR